MNKNAIIISIIITAVAIILGLYFIRYSLDPFGALPKGASPNCGPEYRYKFDATINSKEDFINFLKTHEVEDVSLDNFKKISQEVNYEQIKAAEVDWDKVLNQVKTRNAGLKKMYILNFNAYSCSGFTLKMTSDGYVSVYGCCGK
jgi:hypothetical protein